MMVMEQRRLVDIKEAGGITIAQKPETAVQPDMPESAIDSGHVSILFFHLRRLLMKIIKIAYTGIRC
jgi:two-component system, chemotaxis family, protein-glutamate methylesterase/glutaminase